jgi:hypothetical protein
MKELMRSVARKIWTSLAGIRAPMQRRLTAFFQGIHREGLAAEMANSRAMSEKQSELILRLIEHSKEQQAATHELNLCLDQLVRELIRLQQQMETLSESHSLKDGGSTLTRRAS